MKKWARRSKDENDIGPGGVSGGKDISTVEYSGMAILKHGEQKLKSELEDDGPKQDFSYSMAS